MPGSPAPTVLLQLSTPRATPTGKQAQSQVTHDDLDGRPEKLTHQDHACCFALGDDAGKLVGWHVAYQDLGSLADCWLCSPDNRTVLQQHVGGYLSRCT